MAINVIFIYLTQKLQIDDQRKFRYLSQQIGDQHKFRYVCQHTFGFRIEADLRRFRYLYLYTFESAKSSIQISDQYKIPIFISTYIRIDDMKKIAYRPIADWR